MRLVAALATALLTFGCANQHEAGPTLPPALLPNLDVGDTFSFDDGHVEHVVARSADLVEWRGSDNFIFSSTPNVLLPRIAWSDGDMRGERRMAVTPTSLFPLSPGNNVAFRSVRRTVDDRTGAATEVVEDWQCRVDNTIRVATKVGDFDTFRVGCTLMTMPPTTRLTRTFFYAPAINYFVRREDRTQDGETRVITLTAFSTAEPSLPAQAQRRRAAARQAALETVAGGQNAAWRDEATDASGTVQPISTMKSSRHGWCRVYQESIAAHGRRYHFERLACRERDGIWLPTVG